MTEIDYTLCTYCRGYKYRDINGVESIVIKHGEKRTAAGCRCECHADQVVSKTSFELTMTVTLDVKEAFLRYCEERSLTQVDFADGDAAFDDDNFCEWLADDVLDDCGGDITGPGVLEYQSDVDGYSFNPLDGVDVERLLALAVPLLPVSPDWTPPPSGADLGMEPMFTEGEI